MIVIDDFIKDKKYLKELTLKKDEFFKDLYDSDNYAHDVNWWKGWWVDKPKNINQELIKYIVSDLYLKGLINSLNIKGFEYWTHIHSTKKLIEIGKRTVSTTRHLGWHTNKDELLHYETKEFKHPIFSIIFWPFEQDVDGGYLEMSPIRQEEEEIEILGYRHCVDCGKEKIPFDVERIKPKYNRLVIQDPSYWHRVTHVENGTRWTFVIDVWDTEIIINNKMER